MFVETHKEQLTVEEKTIHLDEAEVKDAILFALTSKGHIPDLDVTELNVEVVCGMSQGEGYLDYIEVKVRTTKNKIRNKAEPNSVKL